MAHEVAKIGNHSPLFSVILFDCPTSSRIVSTKRFTISLIICLLNRLNDSFDASKLLFVSLIAAVNVFNSCRVPAGDVLHHEYELMT